MGFLARTLFTIILASCAGESVAGPPTTVHVMNGLDYIVPENSPVAFSKLGDFTTAYFDGRFTLTGQYFFGNTSHAITESADTDAWHGLELYFVPDKAYRQNLPHTAGRVVKEIWFKNNDDFVRAAIPSNVVAKVRATPGYTASGRASIIVEGYEASVECDYSAYSVHFASLSGMAKGLRVAQRALEEHGC